MSSTFYSFVPGLVSHYSTLYRTRKIFNNLYSHTLEFSPKSPEIVLKLSELLRFMIYESNSNRISLTREINLLKDYIALEKLRYGDRLDISIKITGNIDKYQIAPLLGIIIVVNVILLILNNFCPST
ncbi:histidine kinase [Christiangramia sabulilitoris]|uniref:Histidine kinase n=1 Tax=Christiangramia sabulilitoris TaxID=2583991 RepID=A0A550HXB7_9FLAO|nr:histidine kinase [Christiangramia sabulilitoris]